MLDLEPTADTDLLQQSWVAVGGAAADRIVLTAEQEQAYHRLADRLTAISPLGDPLLRWALGTRDHH